MGPGPEKKHKRPVGSGLSLDKFASLGVSKFDKRKKLERIQKQKLIKHSKYKKLKQRLEKQGLLSGAPVKDSVAELEALDADAPSDGAEDNDVDQGTNNSERAGSNARAGPSSQPQLRVHGKPFERLDKATTGAAAAAATAAKPNSRQWRPESADVALGSSTASYQQGAADRKRPRGDSDTTAPTGAAGRKRAKQSQNAGRVEDGSGGRSGGGGGGRGEKHTGEPGGQCSGRAPGGVHQEQQQRCGGGDGGGGRGGIGGKKLSQLQRLAQQVAEEKAEKQRAKEETIKAREERMQKVAAVEKVRKVQKHLHFKRTAKGQPLMRYRMEKLLSKLQNEEAQ